MSKKFLGFLIFLVLAGTYYQWNREKRLSKAASDAALIAAPSPNDLLTDSASETVTEAPIAGLAKLPKPDQRKFRILANIFATRNDNDPRMDSDLAHLSPELRKAFTEYYQRIEPEKRNQRGTIVFLVGRNISNQADLNFMKSVLMEEPCYSLQNCNKPTASGKGNDPHLDSVNETTVNYPQLMAIHAAIDRYHAILGDPEADQALAPQMIELIREATHSPNPRVVQDAKNALHYLGK